MLHLARSTSALQTSSPFSAVGLADVISSPFRAAFNYPAFHWPVAGLVVGRVAKNRDAPPVSLSNVTFLSKLWKRDREQPLKWVRLILDRYRPVLNSYFLLTLLNFIYFVHWNN